MLITISFAFQDGKTFISLPQRENQDFLTHKTNSSSGGDSFHSELMTPPSDSHFSPDRSKSSSGSGLTKLSGGSCNGSNIPNWSDFFPPPPNCPPSDSESVFNTPRVPRNLGYQVKSYFMLEVFLHFHICLYRNKCLPREAKETNPAQALQSGWLYNT